MIQVGDVNIVVNHNDILRSISRRAALGSHVADLHGVSWIFLLDRDAMKHPGSADFVAPHLLDAGHAGVGDILLDCCGA